MPAAPFFTEVMPTTLFYFLHVIARGATYIILLSYCPAFGFASIGLTILALFAVLHCKSILKWGCPGARFTNFQELFLTRILNAILNRLTINS
jgi:hypothetical protein